MEDWTFERGLRNCWYTDIKPMSKHHRAKFKPVAEAAFKAGYYTGCGNHQWVHVLNSIAIREEGSNKLSYYYARLMTSDECRKAVGRD